MKARSECFSFDEDRYRYWYVLCKIMMNIQCTLRNVYTCCNVFFRLSGLELFASVLQYNYIYGFLRLHDVHHLTNAGMYFKLSTDSKSKCKRPTLTK